MSCNRVTLHPLAPRILACLLLCAGATFARAAEPVVVPIDTPAAAMRASYVALRPQLARNPFGRPLVLLSNEGAGSVSGDVHAVIDAPFKAAGAALASPEEWCGIVFLHINTMACRASNGTPGKVLDLWIGQKEAQPLADASRLALSFRIASRTAGYLRVALHAPEGPMGTRDYRILLEAIPLENGQTFIRLAYAYGYDNFGKLAMQVYLATIGRNKVGFTLLAAAPGDGEASVRHIGGPRGMVERNTMRYFLAIEAYLGALSLPAQSRFEKRIHDWHAATERYPRQLHEMGETDYLAMKRETRLRPLPPPA